MLEAMTDESPETEIALLKHRVAAIEDEMKAVKGWGFKAAVSLIGALAMTYWDKIQHVLKASGK
jgi:hypothetical protein